VATGSREETRHNKKPGLVLIQSEATVGQRASVVQLHIAVMTKRSDQGARLGQWLTWQIKLEDFAEFTRR
jgi:hypothetical protein